jgi:hypothetical protein
MNIDDYFETYSAFLPDPSVAMDEYIEKLKGSIKLYMEGQKTDRWMIPLLESVEEKADEQR